MSELKEINIDKIRKRPDEKRDLKQDYQYSFLILGELVAHHNYVTISRTSSLTGSYHYLHLSKEELKRILKDFEELENEHYKRN